MTDLLRSSEPLVAFVGAGASALPPSSLPTWRGFNDLLLESLADQLAEYSGNRQPTEELLSVFRARRDDTRFFAPDFQAQLMEEEVGAEYFRVWQSLESSVYGPVHEHLAELASRGRLAAIITTNFDRLIETALRDRDQPFEVFYDRESFGALARVVAGEPPSALPIIKIHGSIEDASSLVDTLKQRLVGRPEPLGNALQVLLRKHPWLYLGFSGADFSYDPHYLGILDAAAEARGFVFLAREGATLEDGVRTLAEAYGPRKSAIVHGDLPEWLSRSFGLAETVSEAGGASGEGDATLRVRGRIREWVRSLGAMSTVNILYSMLQSSGLEADALWLMRRTWASYRSPDDTPAGKSYDRFNYNYGVSLLETGFITNPVRLLDDMSNLVEWKEAADQNACEYLARAYRSGTLAGAGAQLARALAYRGDVGEAIALAAAATDEALARNAPLEYCEVAIACAGVYDVVQVFGPAIGQLQRCVELAKDLGDEPRRAMLCAHLGRFLTYAGHFEAADRSLAEAERTAGHLDLRRVLLACRAARGLWQADSGASPERGVETLREVAGAIRALNDVPLATRVDPLHPERAPRVTKGQHPLLCRVLLDLNRAAMLAGDAGTVEETLDALDELVTGGFPGYCPHYYLAYVQCLLTMGAGNQRELVLDLLGRARALGEASGNPWAAEAAGHLEHQISGEM